MFMAKRGAGAMTVLAFPARWIGSMREKLGNLVRLVHVNLSFSSYSSSMWFMDRGRLSRSFCAFSCSFLFPFLFPLSAFQVPSSFVLSHFIDY